MLILNNISSYYGHLVAIKDVSLTVEAGSMVTLIGSNGAGKSTTLKTIAGLLSARVGRITFLGKEIGHLPAAERAALGIALVPEGRRVFSSLTVLENLKLGAFLHWRRGGLDREIEEMLEHFPALRHRRRQRAVTLSGGEQQMLAIARALMGHPKLLLLDEPSMGLAPILVRQIFTFLRQLNQRGTTILFVEQNAQVALATATEGYVMERGEIVLHDRCDRLLNDQRVKKAYLGD